MLCPYKGLARFEKQDAAIFHGREALVATLVARLADTPLVVVAAVRGGQVLAGPRGPAARACCRGAAGQREVATARAVAGRGAPA